MISNLYCGYHTCFIVDFSRFDLIFSGVSSFNQLIHELSVDSDTSSIDYSSGEEDNDGSISPSSPASQSSRVSRSSIFSNHDRGWTGWVRYIFLWILVPAKFLLGIPFRILHSSYNRGPKASVINERNHPSKLRSFKKMQTLKDHIVHRTTDKRRGVIEVSSGAFYNTYC